LSHYFTVADFIRKKRPEQRPIKGAAPVPKHTHSLAVAVMMVVHTMVMVPWCCTGAADGSEANTSYKEHGDYLFHCFSFFGYAIVVTKCEPTDVKSAGRYC
jgi:hypothetical protein